MSWKLCFNLCSQRWPKTSPNLVSNCIPFGLLQKKGSILGMTYKFQNVTFETSETFGITNVQTQFILVYHSWRKQTIFETIMF